MAEKIRWGILGYARIARESLMPAILKSSNAELLAVASREPENLSACQEQFKCPRTYGSYEQLLSDPDVQAVYIPLPNSMHCEWTLKAARMGKHVLCEKPLALCAADAERMATECRKNGVKLMEAFMYRYSERTRRVREVLESSALGDIKYINSCYRFFLNRENTIKMRPELGGGSLFDVGCYPVNFIGMATNASPVSVSAQAVLQHGVDVLFSAALKYENGILANVNCGFNAFNRTYSEIVGTRGVLEIPSTFQGIAGSLTLSTADGVREIPVAESERYVLEVEDFSEAIARDRPPAIGLEESMRNAELIERLHQAIGVQR